MDGVFLKYHKNLMWQCDNDGYELGYDDVNIIGTYSLADTNILFLIDMEKNTILEGFIDQDE